MHPRKVFVPEEDHLPIPIHDDRRISFDFDARFHVKNNLKRPVTYVHNTNDGIVLKPRFGENAPELRNVDDESDPLFERVRRDMRTVYDTVTPRETS